MDAKKVIKSIVKECLLEIIAEGLENKNKLKESKEFASAKKIKNSRPIANQKSIEKITDEITDNKILRSILADTAKTTLIEQNKHEKNIQGKETLPIFESSNDAGVDIDAIFKEAKNNWSQMAFTVKK